MKRWLAKQYVTWRLSGTQRTFFVYGMRRSGNHACVGWLANALESRPVELRQDPAVANFNRSDSGDTFFVNDVTAIHLQRYLELLHKYRRVIRRARFVIVSAEDKDARYIADPRIPAHSEVIQVRRSTLNLMASRFQNLNRRAQEGLGANLQSMKARFFDTLAGQIGRPVGSIWKLECWREDAAWRQRFLDQLGLAQDIMPATVGLGSSFSADRSVSGSERLAARYAMVEPRAAWTAFIQRAATEHPEVFSADERSIIQSLSAR